MLEKGEGFLEFPVLGLGGRAVVMGGWHSQGMHLWVLWGAQLCPLSVLWKGKKRPWQGSLEMNYL